MAGYSGTPLVQKLGVKAGHKVSLIKAPAGFRQELGALPDQARFSGAANGPLDVVLLFVKSRGELEAQFGDLAKRLASAGMLWVAWPKKASGVATDLTENVVREIGLEGGLVDIKVCAVDEVWSGLKFVIRLKDRPKAAR